MASCFWATHGGAERDLLVLQNDLRTGVETGNPDAVLDGNLEEFVVAFLMGVRRDVSDVE